MAKTTDLGITNRTVSLTRVNNEYTLGETTNYTARDISTNKETATRLSNRTAEEIHGEVVKVFYRDLKEHSTELDQYERTPATGWMIFGVTVDAMATTTDSAVVGLDPEIREPIEVTTSVKIPKSPYITDVLIDELIDRCRSYFKREDGTSRISDFRRGATNVKEN